VATTDMGRKEGGGCCVPFVGELGPRLTQYGLGRGLLLYQVASSFIQPFGHNRHRPKLGGGCALFSGGIWVPIERKVAWDQAYLHTKWHSSPSIFGHNGHWQKIGGCAPLGERELGPHLTQCRLC